MLLVAERGRIDLGDPANGGESGDLRLRREPALDRRQMRIERRPCRSSAGRSVGIITTSRLPHTRDASHSAIKASLIASYLRPRWRRALPTAGSPALRS